jgi:hypothetical protein
MVPVMLVSRHYYLFRWFYAVTEQPSPETLETIGLDWRGNSGGEIDFYVGYPVLLVGTGSRCHTVE